MKKTKDLLAVRTKKGSEIMPLTGGESFFGIVASFFVELGIESIISLVNSAAKENESSVLSAITNILVGPTERKLEQLLDAMKEIKEELRNIDAEIVSLDSTVREMCGQIIDILNQKIVQDEFQRMMSVTQGNIDYSGAWAEYLDIIDYINKLNHEPNASDFEVINARINTIVSEKLNLHKPEDATALYKDISKLANIVSDCNDGSLSSSVSEKPNVTGGHFVNDQTYVKAVLGQVIDSKPFEHQLSAIMANELHRVIIMQVQLLVLYNEVTCYLLDQKDPSLLSIGTTLKGNYVKVYNLTVNSINNALEQSHLAELMSPQDVKCSLYLSDNDITDGVKNSFFRVKMTSKSYDGDIYYIAKKSVSLGFVEDATILDHKTYYNWNTKDKHLHMRYLRNADTRIGKLSPAIESNGTVTGSQLNLFNSHLFIPEKGILDYLNTRGFLEVQPAPYKYIMLDAPTGFDDKNLSPGCHIVSKTKYVSRATFYLYWLEFYWMKVNDSIKLGALTKCSSDVMVKEKGEYLLVMKGLESYINGKLEYGYKSKIIISTNGVAKFGSIQIKDAIQNTTNSFPYIYSDFEPKAKFKLQVKLNPYIYLKSISYKKYGYGESDFGYFKPIVMVSTNEEPRGHTQTRSFDLDLVNFFDATEIYFEFACDESYVDVVTTRKSSNIGGGHYLITGTYVLHNAVLMAKGFQSQVSNSGHWDDIPISGDGDFSLNVSAGKTTYYRAYVIDKNGKTYYGNSVTIVSVR